MAADSLSGDLVQLRILPGWQRTDGSRMAALQIELPAGWKTYWRAPGDAGIPPVIDWSGSRNLRAVTPVWPTPQVFSQNGMTSVGYQDRLLLPVVLSPKDDQRPIRLRGQLQIGICKDICIPAELDFDSAFAPAAGATDASILAALNNRPLPADKAGVSHVSCTLEPTADGLRLRADLRLPSTGRGEYAVVEAGDPKLWVAEADLQRRGDRLRLDTEVMHVEGEAFALNRSALRITVLGSRHAVDIQGCPAKG